MNTADWLACTDPIAMLGELQRIASVRKMRLFALACCDRYASFLSDESIRQQVARLDELAEFPIAAHELTRVRAAAWDYTQQAWSNLRFKEGDSARVVWAAASDIDCASNAANAARLAAWVLSDFVIERNHPGKPVTSSSLAAIQHCQQTERRAQADILRDLFGLSPCIVFYPISNWVSSSLVAMAECIYEQGAFQLMPIFADLLEDNGCNNVDILDHCRSKLPHVKGCWVVDLVLGKS